MKQQSNHLLIFLLVILPVIFADDKCINDNQWCSESCEQRGFISYGYNTRGCRYPEYHCVKDDSCADADSPENTKACILIGMKKKKGTIGSCEMPTDCVAAGKFKCSSAISSIACKSLGFVKSDTTDDCVYPKNCLRMTSGTPCLEWSEKTKWTEMACIQLGYEADMEYNCKIPQDCIVGDQCQTPKIACIETGFTKNSENDNCVCQGPFKTLIDKSKFTFKKRNQCVDCKRDSNGCSNACIALGWVTSAAGDKCVQPADADCLAQPNACDSNKFCVVVKGFVAKSDKDKSCMVPAKCDEASQHFCSSASSVCASSNGFTKKQSSDDCECASPKVVENNKCITPAPAPAVDKCIQHTFCSKSCLKRGFQDVNDNQDPNNSGCRYPLRSRCYSNDSCADTNQPDNTKACILIGMKKKEGTMGSCKWPTDCLAVGKSNCSSAISSITCKRFGFVKSDTTDDCVYPKNCLSLSEACRGDKNYNACRQFIHRTYQKVQCVDCKRDQQACSKACIALGWVTSAAGNKCVEPADADCLAQPNACDSKKVCVVVKGFVARSNTDKGCMVPAKV